jgi:hypothetical protein
MKSLKLKLGIYEIEFMERKGVLIFWLTKFGNWLNGLKIFSLQFRIRGVRKKKFSLYVYRKGTWKGFSFSFPNFHNLCNLERKL